MPRRRRRIESKKAYEICFRARNSLPLVARDIIKLIIQHALARAQRDEKLYLCHDIWNGSHPHIIALSKDAEQCKKFYMEVQKKITDCLKRLFGLPSLSIWEGRPTVALIGDLDEAVNRISYLYANPAQDNLESSIEEFPGYSSWKWFQLGMEKEDLSVSFSEEVKRLRLPSFPTLKTYTPDTLREHQVIRLLKKKNKEKQTLTRYPNMWMSAFGVQEKDIPEINVRIVRKIRRREHLSSLLRRLSGKPLMGKVRLKKQAILKKHTPKKKERKVFYFGSCNKERVSFLAEFDQFCKRCRECYEEWLFGNFLVKWPPGAFKPPLPPNMNILELLE